MITIKDKCSCCGCSACASVCPKHCITMCEDDEGFLYPAADENTCIECGLCEVVCPVIHVQPDVEKEQRAYLVQHKNEQVLLAVHLRLLLDGCLIEEVLFVVQVSALILRWCISGLIVMKI